MCFSNYVNSFLNDVHFYVSFLMNRICIYSLNENSYLYQLIGIESLTPYYNIESTRDVAAINNHKDLNTKNGFKSNHSFSDWKFQLVN